MSMYSDSLNVTPEVVRRDNVGDIFTHTDGHRYRVTKKTRSAIAVERYYWYHAFLNKLMKKSDGGPNVPHTP